MKIKFIRSHHCWGVEQCAYLRCATALLQSEDFLGRGFFRTPGVRWMRGVLRISVCILDVRPCNTTRLHTRPLLAMNNKSPRETGDRPVEGCVLRETKTSERGKTRDGFDGRRQATR